MRRRPARDPGGSRPGAPSRVRCGAVGSSVFFGILFVAVNAWSVIDIFVLGRFEEKFGGPMENLILGLLWSALAFLLSALGCLVAVLVLFGRVRPARPGDCRYAGAAAAAIAFGLLVSGLFPWFERAVPLVEGTAAIAGACVLVGLLSGFGGAFAVALARRGLRTG